MKLILTRWVILSLSALLIGCGGDSSPPKYQISGHVDGPVGVLVELSKDGSKAASTTTNSSGDYSFGSLAPGEYSVVPTFGDWIYSPSRFDVDLNSDVTTQVFAVAAEPDGLPQELLDYLDTVPPETIEPEDLIVRGALTRSKTLRVVPQLSGEEKRVELLEELLNRGNYYACGHNSPACTTWNREADQIGPKQTVLGYVLGSNDTVNRRANIAGTCKQQIVGVDCSNFVRILLSAVGISVDQPRDAPGSSGLANADNWHLPPEWGLAIEQVTDGNFQKGDFVYWTPPSPGKYGHIGIAYGDGTNPKVLSSIGGLNDCPKNLKNGPVAFKMNTVEHGVMPAWGLRIVTVDGPEVHIDTYIDRLGVSIPLTANVVDPAVPPTKPAPTGTLIFRAGDRDLCRAEVKPGGAATCEGAISGIPTTLTAAYGGDAVWGASSSSVVVDTIPKQYKN